MKKFGKKEANEMMFKSYICKNDSSVTARISSIMFYDGAHPHYPCTLHQGWTVNYITNKCYINNRLSIDDFKNEYEREYGNDKK